MIRDISWLPFGSAEGISGSEGIKRTFDSRYMLSGIQVGSIMDISFTRSHSGKVTEISDFSVPTSEAGRIKYAYRANRLLISNGQEETRYTYDHAGNIVSDGTRTFTYNQSGRLIQVADASGVIAIYVYDAFGRRAKKSVGNKVVYYFYGNYSAYLTY